MPERLTMTHPELPDQPIRVAAPAVPAHQRAGWQLADTEPDQPPAEPVDNEE